MGVIEKDAKGEQRGEGQVVEKSSEARVYAAPIGSR
jgi:hypothetical protein